MGKHAYLIIAHHLFDQLEILLKLLDDDRNDIYLHIDKKAKNADINRLRNVVQKAGLTFTERQNVKWGTASQVACEFLLLQAAVERGPYQYYHLLSGVDLPLKTQNEIHAFFSENQGKEFIDIEMPEIGAERLSRIRYWHCGRRSKSKIVRALSRGALELQKAIGLNRLKRCRWRIQKGGNWFSITENLAEYALLHEKELSKLLSYSWCADELMIQTALVNSPYAENRYCKDTYNSGICCVRAIDWERGTPYTWRIDDYEELMSSGCMFARKFSLDIDSKIIFAIQNSLLTTGEYTNGAGEN